MEEELDNKHGITKVEWLSWRITKELEESKDINGYGKINYEETVQQEEKKSTRIEERRKHVVEG